MGGYILPAPNCCCEECQGKCCCCQVDSLFLCKDQGTVPTLLHLTLTTGCGVYETELTRRSDTNCWEGVLSDFACRHQDQFDPTQIECLHYGFVAVSLCCGSRFPSNNFQWVFRIEINPAGPFQVVGTVSCKPFMARFDLPSGGVRDADDCLYDVPTFQAIVTE